MVAMGLLPVPESKEPSDVAVKCQTHGIWHDRFIDCPKCREERIVIKLPIIEWPDGTKTRGGKIISQ
jgi:hypothetical protein